MGEREVQEAKVELQAAIAKTDALFAENFVGIGELLVRYSEDEAKARERFKAALAEFKAEFPAATPKGGAK